MLPQIMQHSIERAFREFREGRQDEAARASSEGEPSTAAKEEPEVDAPLTAETGQRPWFPDGDLATLLPTLDSLDSFFNPPPALGGDVEELILPQFPMPPGTAAPSDSGYASGFAPGYVGGQVYCFCHETPCDCLVAFCS